MRKQDGPKPFNNNFEEELRNFVLMANFNKYTYIGKC